MLVTRYTEQYEQVMLQRAEQDSYILDAERAILTTDHAAVGKVLTAYWKFPEDMQNAVAHHHDIDQANDGMLTAIVHIADILAHALDLSQDEEALVPVISNTAWDKLKLTQEISTKVFRETEKQFEEICQILIN